MYPASVKAEAIRLRTEDLKSIGEIKRVTGVAKGILSLWLRPYPLPEEALKARKKAQGKRLTQHIYGDVAPATLKVGWAERPPLSKADLGEACRQIISARLMFQGVKVFRPLGEDTPIDLLILTSDGRALKCQCKCIYKESSKNNHSMKLCSVRKWGPSSKVVVHVYTASEVDVFLGYCPDNDTVYVIPYAEAKGRAAIQFWVTSERKNKHCGELEQSKWANNYSPLK